MPLSPGRRFVARTSGALALLALVSCFGDSTGPSVEGSGRLNLVPSFSAGSGLVDFDEVRIRLTAPGGGLVLDTTIVFPAGSDTLTLSLAVPAGTVGRPLDLVMDLIDQPSGNVVFTVGPASVTPQAGSGGAPQALPPFLYIGPGAGATGVRFVTPQPSEVFFLDSVTLVAEAVDAGGAVVPLAPIRWTSSDTSRAILRADSTGRVVARAARGGVTITASLLRTSTAAPAQVSRTLAVQPRASQITAQVGQSQTGAAGATLGAPITARVLAADGLGVQGIVVTFAVTGGGGSLSAVVDTTDANGDASTQWTLGGALGAGAQSVLASATGIAGASIGFTATATAGSGARLAFVQEPTAANELAVIAPPVTVRAFDQFGNASSTFNGPVTLALLANPGGANLSGTLTRAAVSGVVTFNDLSLNNAGTGYTLRASSGTLASDTSAAFNITANTPVALAFQVQPANTVAGATIAPAVQVRIVTAGGATVTTATNLVTLAIGANPGTGTLSGTLSVAAVNGVATFGNLSIDSAGSGYTLVVAATGLTGATSAGFDITAGAPQLLRFAVQPATTAAGATLAPSIVVEALDALGNRATGFNGPVTLAIGSNPGGATLSGTLTQSAVSGVATFSNITLTTRGAGYTLTASATGVTGVTGVTSAPFDMTALTLTWTNPAGGSWSNASNWSLGRVPQTTDSVVINLAGTYTVALDTTFAASFLNLGGAVGTQTLSLSSRTLSISGTMTVLPGGAFLADNSTLTGVGSVLNQGSLTLRQTTVATATSLINQGTLVANATVNVNGPFTAAAASTLRLLPDGSSGFVNLTVAQGFTNNGTIELTSAAGAFSSQLTVPVAATLTNAPGATIATLVGAGGPRTLQARLINQGTVTLLQPLTINQSSVAHDNSGTIDASGADLALSQGGTAPSFSNSGTITIGTGRTWTVSGGTLNQNAGTIGGAGTLSLQGATANFVTSFSNATTALVADNATLNGPGSITNASGQTMTLRQTTIGAPFVNQGTLISNGTVTAGGSFTMPAGAVLRLQPDGTTGFSNLTVAQGFTNSGTIELTSIAGAFSSQLTVPSGATLTNAPGATITTLLGAGGPRTLQAQLDNQGTLTLLQPLTMNQSSVQHANSGTIDASAADFALSQGGTAPSFSNSGTITIGSGRTWTVTGGTLNQSAGALGGPGTLSLQAVTANFTTNFTNATTIMLVDNSTLNGPGTITNAAGRTLTLRQTTIGATSALINQGTLITNGTVTVNAPLTSSAGTIIRLQPDGTTGFNNLTVVQGFTNSGTIELTSVAGAFSAQLTVPPGAALTNAPGATISSLVGAGGPRTLQAQLNNQGALTLLQPLTMNQSSVQHTNSGTIDASAADLILSQGGAAPSFSNSGTITIGAGRTWTVTGGTLNQNAGSIGGPGLLSLQAMTGNFVTNVSNAVTALTVDNSTLNGPGTITNAAGQTLTLRQTTIGATSALINQGTLITNGTVTVNAPLTTGTGTIIRLQPDGTTGFNNLTVAPGFTNNGTIELTSIAGAFSSQLTVPTGGTLTNAAGATISSLVGAGGPRTIQAQLDNQGTLTLLQPLTMNQSSVQHANSGTIDASAADFILSQGGTAPSFSNSGSITIGAGRTFTINGGTLNQSAGSLGGPGTLNLQAVTANFTTSFTNATTAMLVDNSTLNGPGTITNAAGRTLTLRQTTIGASSALINQGTLITNGTVNLNGPLTTGSGTVIRLQPDGTTGFNNLTIAQGFTNDGTIEMTSIAGGFSATLIVPATNTLTNAAGGTITSVVGAGGPRTIQARLDNQGTLTVLQPLSLNQSSVAHSNSGLIDAGAAGFTVSQSGTSPSFSNTGAGTITVGPAHAFTVSGGAFTHDGTLDGGGAMTLNSVTAAFNSGFTLSSFAALSSTVSLAVSLSTSALALSFDNATINGPGTITNASGQTLALRQTTIAATSALINQGTLITNGTVNINGPLTAAAGSMMRLQPDGSTGFNNLTVAQGFTNNGGIELTSIAGGFSATLIVPSANALTNASGATITSVVGAGGPRIIQAQLNNQGTVTVLQPLTLNQSSVAHSNSGLIDASAADLLISQSGSTPSFTSISTGVLTIGTGRTLTVTGGTFTHGGTLNGGGAMVLNSVAAALNAGFTLGSLAALSSTVSLGTSLSTGVLALSFDNATVNGPGTITNPAGQTLTLRQTTIAATSGLINQGTLITNGTVTVNGPLTAAAGGIIRLQPDGSTGFNNLTVAQGFSNNGAIELTSVAGGFSTNLIVPGTNTLINAAGATITSVVGAGGPRAINAQLNNQGTLTLLQPLTLNQLDADHSNSGLIDASAAGFTISQTGTSPSFINASAGTVTIGPTRTLTLTGGTFTQDGTLNGGGALVLNSAAAALNTGFTLGSLGVLSSTVSLATDLSTSALALSFDNATINGPGTITNAVGQTLTLRQTTIAATSGLINQGTLITNGTVNVNGPLTAAAGGTIRLLPDGSTGFNNLTMAQGFTNDGLIEMSSVSGGFSASLIVQGTLDVSAGGSINVLPGSGGARTIDAQLNNFGAITISQPLALNGLHADHVNGGTMNAATAGLTLNQSGTSPSFTNVGTLTLGAGQTGTINGGAFSHQPGAVLNGGGTLTLNSLLNASIQDAFSLGALNVNSTTLNLASGVNVSTSSLALSLFSAIVNGPGIITNAAGQTLVFTGSNVTASSGLDNQGTLLVNGGSQVNGGFNTAPGSTIRVRPDGTTGFATLSLPSSGFVNNGLIELTSAGGAFPAQVQANSGGTFTNGAGGTVSTLPGTGGTRTLGSVNNQGALTVVPGPSSSGVLQIGGTLTTSGSITLELAGTAAGTGHSQVSVSGAANLGGTLNFSLTGGFTPAAATQFTILTSSSRSGTFTLGTQPGGWAAPTYPGNTAVLTSP